MRSTNISSLSDIPEEGLRFFHGLSNWIEKSKKVKPHLVNWKHAMTASTKLNCIKLKQGERVKTPIEFRNDTLYVPNKSSGIYVFQQLRHAFCHNDLVYDKNINQYRIELTDKVKIAGWFSLEAIEEFVNIFLKQSNNQ